MANWAYLTRSDFERIYPSFENKAYDSKKHTLLASAGGVPLIWWFLFDVADLKTSTFTTEEPESFSSLDALEAARKAGNIKKKVVTFEETAPLVLAVTALERLHARQKMMNEWYAGQGGLDHHFNMFTTWLSAHEGRYLSVEWQEIICLFRENVFLTKAREILKGIAERDIRAKKPLAELSTIMEERRFYARKELDDPSSGAKQEDYWNYHRIMGEGYLTRPPWR